MESPSASGCQKLVVPVEKKCYADKPDEGRVVAIYTNQGSYCRPCPISGLSAHFGIRSTEGGEAGLCPLA